MRQLITRIHVAVLTLIVLAAVAIVARAQVVNGFGTLMDGGNIPSNSCTANCAATTLLGPFDTTGYISVNVQVTSVGGGATITWQESDDNPCSSATNWNNVASLPDSATVSSNLGQTSVTFVGNTTIPARGRCFRAQITAYTSGTITAEGILRTAQGPVSVVAGQIGISYPAYPSMPASQAAGGTAISCGATGSTSAVTCTLAGTAGKTTYICGFDITAVGGTAAVTPAVATLIGSVTMTYTLNSSATGVFLSREFTPCIPTTAVNTAITVTSTADGTATAVDVNAHGFQL